jgi:hypothetical protein
MIRIRSLADFHALSAREQRDYLSVVDLVYEMRVKKRSPAEAIMRSRATPEAIRQYAGGAFTRDKRGRIVAAATDDLLRPMRLISTSGVVEVAPTQAEASLIGRHANEVKRFGSGISNATRLSAFKGRRAAGHELETDLDAIEDLLRRGELDWLDLYLRP